MNNIMYTLMYVLKIEWIKSTNGRSLIRNLFGICVTLPIFDILRVMDINWMSPYIITCVILGVLTIKIIISLIKWADEYEDE